MNKITKMYIENVEWDLNGKLPFKVIEWFNLLQNSDRVKA